MRHLLAFISALGMALLAQASYAAAAGQPAPVSPATVSLPIAPPAPASPVPVSKDFTLNDALAEAWQKNPDLEAARAELKSVEENHPQAVAGFLPTVDGEVDYTSTHEGPTNADPKELSLIASQSLYSGGSTMAGVSQADNQIKAEDAKLKISEQQVLLDAVTAYVNFLRDRDIVELDINNEKVLVGRMDEARERFTLGDITKTDVSQAESRLARATATRIAAEGDLKKSRAAFEKVIGLPPQTLQKPDLSITLPPTEDEAIAQALQRNPAIFFAKYNREAAKATTRIIEGQNLPQVALTGSVGKIYDPINTTLPNENAQSIGVTATIPLYAGGATMSRIRQSRQIENQLRMQMQSAESLVHETTVQAWEGLAAATAETQALQSQIDAAKLALEGVEVEMKYGTRTTLDMLDAQQEYLQAQVGYVGAETDRIIATYTLLSALGRLTGEDLKLK